MLRLRLRLSLRLRTLVNTAAGYLFYTGRNVIHIHVYVADSFLKDHIPCISFVPAISGALFQNM